MSKTFLETFNIHKGTYNQIKDHIGKNDLGFATDKGLPVPTQDDINKFLVVGPDGNYHLATKQLSRNYVYSTQESFINCIKYEQVNNTYKLTRIKNEQTTLDQDIQYFELGANFYIAEKEVPDYWLASKEIILGEGETFSPLLFFQELETKYEAPIKFFTGIALEGREWVDGELIYCTENSTNYIKGNYYYYNGTVHKVATDADVNTKLDKSEFNTFKDNLNSILENIQPSAIVDIEELVYPGWKGTSFINGETLENLYFNTNLSTEETIEIIKNSNYKESQFSTGIYLSYFFRVDGDGGDDLINTFVLAKVFNGTDYVYLIGNLICILALGTGSFDPNAKVLFSSQAEPDFGIVAGWNQSISNPININKEVIIGEYAIDTPSIMSSTQIEYFEPNLKDDVFYRLSKKSDPYIKGTTVPNSGYVDKLYFNTNLSTDEVDALLSKLTYVTTEDSGNNIGTTSYGIIAENINMNPRGIFVLKESNGYIILQLMPTTQIFYVSPGVEGWGTTGWNTFTNPFILGYEVKSSANLGPIGQNNDLLNSLIATTPFVETQDILGYELYMYKNGEYIKVYPQLPIVDLKEPLKPKGTALKEGDTIIYFNTKISYDYIYNWASTQTNWVNMSDFLCIHLGAVQTESGSFTPAISLLKMFISKDAYAITLLGEMPLWVDEEFAKYSGEMGMTLTPGWNLDYVSSLAGGISFDPLDLSIEGLAVSLTDGQNDYTNKYNELSWLFSSTPFSASTESTILNKNHLYNIPTEGTPIYQGTTVPRGGLVENLYINTEMSVEDVTSLLKNLPYENFMDNSSSLWYPIVYTQNSDNYLNTTFAVFKDVTNNVYGIGNIQAVLDAAQGTTTEGAIMIFASGTFGSVVKGWQEFTNPIVVNATDTYTGEDANESLSSLISSTEFLTIPGEVTYDLYSYNGKTLRKILHEGDVTNSSTVVESTIENVVINVSTLSDFLKIMEGEYTVTITSEQYSNFTSGKKDHLRIDYDCSSIPELNTTNPVHIYVLLKFMQSTNTSSELDGIIFTGVSPSGTSFTVTFKSDTLTASSVTKNVVPGVVKDITYDDDYYIRVSKYSETDPGMTTLSLEIHVSTSVAPNGKALVTSEAVYNALQSYAKKTEVNQMIADYIAANFENGDEGSY